MNKADIKKLQQLLKQMDSDEKRLQLHYGDSVKTIISWVLFALNC